MDYRFWRHSRSLNLIFSIFYYLLLCFRTFSCIFFRTFCFSNLLRVCARYPVLISYALAIFSTLTAHIIAYTCTNTCMQCRAATSVHDLHVYMLVVCVCVCLCECASVNMPYDMFGICLLEGLRPRDPYSSGA